MAPVGVLEALQSAAKAHPQARVIAYADLASRMVLSSAGSDDMTQEYLDTLCGDATASFGEPMSALAEQAFGTAHGALVLTTTSVKLFLRAEAETDDAICCICDHSIDLAAFVATLRSTLDDISGNA